MGAVGLSSANSQRIIGSGDSPQALKLLEACVSACDGSSSVSGLVQGPGSRACNGLRMPARAVPDWPGLPSAWRTPVAFCARSNRMRVGPVVRVLSSRVLDSYAS